MMALASMHDLPTILVPGGVTLPPTTGEDAGRCNHWSSLHPRRHHAGRRLKLVPPALAAVASSWDAATSQVVAGRWV
jgi:dihydroxyacid dehydratase/phosphogluconate dehydratase